MKNHCDLAPGLWHAGASWRPETVAIGEVEGGGGLARVVAA